jgi:hypothetical protein
MATTTTNFGWDIPQSTDLVKDGATAIAALGQDIDTALVDLKGGTTGQVLAKASGTDLDFSWVAQDDSNAIQNAIVDAKGDLISATAADTPARLAVGSNNQVLMADSSTATGLKWAAVPGGLNLVTTQTFSAVTSVSVNSCFSSTYENYMIVVQAHNTATANFIRMRMRASGTDSTSGYYCSFQQTNWVTAGTGNDYANNDNNWRARIGHLDNSSTNQSAINMTLFSPFAAKNTAYSNVYMDVRTVGASGFTGGIHNVASSYDGFTLLCDTAMTGTVRVYGLAN